MLKSFDMEKLRSELIEILKKYTFNKEVWNGFTDSFSIINDLKINSARIVDIIIDIEEKYNIEISDEELDSLTCFGDMLNLVAKKIK